MPCNPSTPPWLVPCPLARELQQDSPGGAPRAQGRLRLGPPLGTARSPEGSDGAEGMSTRPSGKWGLQRRVSRPGRALVRNGGATGWDHSAGMTVITGGGSRTTPAGTGAAFGLAQAGRRGVSSGAPGFRARRARGGAQRGAGPRAGRGGSGRWRAVGGAAGGPGGCARWAGRRDASRRRSRKRCQMLGSRAGGLAAGGGGDLLFFAKSEPQSAAEAAAEGERESEREREESACPRGAAARPRPPRDAR